MQVNTISAAITAAPRPAAQAPAPQTQGPVDAFEEGAQSSSSTGEKLKQWAGIGGAVLVGAGLGFGAGVASGAWVGPAIGGPLGAVAGASGGATLAAFLPGEKIKSGALLGALAGGIIGASTNHPVAVAALTLAGATLPFGLLMAVFSGAE